MSRLKRKDMKRDEVLDWVGRTVEYLRQHTRGLVAIVLAALLVVAVAAVLMSYRGRQVERANRLLGDALIIYNAPIDTVDPKPDDSSAPSFADVESRNLRAKSAFETLHEQFKGTRLGGVAAAYLGDLAADSGEYAEAETLWREAMGDVTDTLLAGRLQMNLINLGLSQGRGESVVEELRGLMNSEESSLPADVVLYELAKALEKVGREEEALGAYESLVEDYETSVYAAEARGKLAAR